MGLVLENHGKPPKIQCFRLQTIIFLPTTYAPPTYFSSLIPLASKLPGYLATQLPAYRPTFALRHSSEDSWDIDHLQCISFGIAASILPEPPPADKTLSFRFHFQKLGQEIAPTVSSNMVIWEIPELIGVFNVQFSSKPCLITRG